MADNYVQSRFEKPEKCIVTSVPDGVTVQKSEKLDRQPLFSQEVAIDFDSLKGNESMAEEEEGTTDRPISEDAEYDRPLGPIPKSYRVDVFWRLVCTEKTCQEGDGDGAAEDNAQFVKCFTSLLMYSRAWQYKNAMDGMILFRGGKRKYPSEKSTLLRESDPEKRRLALLRVLQMVRELRLHYERKTSDSVEGASMMKDITSVASTVRALALMQHYSDVAQVKTPMLDITKDVRVAASFAFQGELKPGSNRCVRLLLVGHPLPVEDLDGSTFWKDQKEKRETPVWLIQRLGGSQMLLVELQTLLPSSAMRPQNQSGYLLVHERDLKACHNLFCQIDWKSTDRQLDELSRGDDADGIVGAKAQGWDALCYPTENMVVPHQVQAADFFHWAPFPQLQTDQLYRNEIDPMKTVIATCVDRLKERANETKRITEDP